MNDVDTTGPVPLIRPGEPLPDLHADLHLAQPVEPLTEPTGPAGWVPERREPAASPGGADPDLPWEFATRSATTGETPVIEPATERMELTGPVIPPTDRAPDADLDELPPPTQPLTQPEMAATLPPPTAAEMAPPMASGGGIRSRHGQPAPLSRAWKGGVAAAIAVAAVVVGIVAFNAASPSPSNRGAGPAFVLPTAAAVGQGGTAITSPPPGLPALPGGSAPPGGSAAPAKHGASAAGSGATPGGAIAPGVPANAPSVTVLNETTTHGLAAAEAEKVRAVGWTVRRVTNINARLTQTTVYYDVSQEAAAKALVASVPSVKVALPRPSYVLSTGGLIVVVASDAA